uniref:NF-E2 Nuclear factor erythroid 2-related factor n=1 Tax=Phallusia mammillata TaxID=59560 RepID=A0A6F9DN16_9ASCI|nr:NF-E2 Nuclear factor erythroid 2-related factor [Phallusia mammillata]
MQMIQQYAKKDLAIGLLDIAIFLALMGQVNIQPPQLIEDLLPPEERFDGLGPVMGLTQLPYHTGVDYPTMKTATFDADRVMHDYSAIMRDAESRLPQRNQSSSASVFNRNVTAMMLRVAETYMSIDNETAQPVTQPRVDEQGFNIFDGVMPQDFNFELANVGQEESNFDNAEDVRWRDFLVEQNSLNNEANNEEKITNETNSEPDLDFLLDSPANNSNEVPNSTRTRTTSNFSEESGIEVETRSPVPSLHDHTYSIESPTLAAANLEESFDLYADEQDQPSTSTGATANPNDVDLMQQMYLQDIDIGYNWQSTEPTKQIKEVDDVLLEKNKSVDSISYFVDGETGEQIPIPPSNNTQSQQNVTNPVQNNNQTNFFNLEEYLGVFDNAGGNQPQNMQAQNNEQNLPVMVSDNIPSAETNEDLWADIATIPELSGLGIANNTNQLMNVNTIDNMSRLPNTTLQNGQNSTIMDQVHMKNVYNTSNLNYSQSETFETQPSNVYKNLTMSSYLGNPAPAPAPAPAPVFQPSHRLSPSFGSSPVRNDEGIPMEGTSGNSSPMSNGDLNDQSYLLGHLNNFQSAMETNESFGSGHSMMSPIAEPGQFFFDQTASTNMNKMLNEIITINSNTPQFENNVTAPYINPPQGPFPPPPLDRNPGFMTFNDDSETLIKTRMESGESYESDSGVSMGHSPQRFGFMGPSTIDETLPFGSVSALKDGLINSQESTLQLEELKHIQHNHTYDGTVGAKNKTKKKSQKENLPRESRDMRKARELNIPFTLNEIVMSPVEEYNEMLARTPLTQTQQALIKDIRRRGKNKVAAQNCRKRKIETITHMEDDVDVLRARKHQLVDEQLDLEATKENMQMRYNSLYQRIFSSLRDESGRPYDASRFSLEQVDSAVLLVPRVAKDDSCRDNNNNSAASGSNGQAMDHDDARHPKVDFFKVKTEKGE